jgi:hypothetical protein
MEIWTIGRFILGVSGDGRVEDRTSEVSGDIAVRWGTNRFFVAGNGDPLDNPLVDILV